MNLLKHCSRRIRDLVKPFPLNSQVESELNKKDVYSFSFSSSKDKSVLEGKRLIDLIEYLIKHKLVSEIYEIYFFNKLPNHVTFFAIIGIKSVNYPVTKYLIRASDFDLAGITKMF